MGNRQNVTFKAIKDAGNTIQILNGVLQADGTIIPKTVDAFGVVEKTTLASNTYNSGLGEKKKRHSKMPKRAVYDIKEVI